MKCAALAAVVWLAACADSPLVEPGDDYAVELAELDESVESLAGMAQAAPGDWMVRERLAAALVSRAQLTGDYEDFAQAQAALDEAFATAAPGSGPWLGQARLDYTLHRLDQAAGALEQLAARSRFVPAVARAVDDLRADLWFDDGEYARVAMHDLEIADAREPGALFRRARYAWATGDFDRADELFAAAAAAYHGPKGSYRAKLALQRGQLDLDRGRYRDALDHFRAADAAFSGWWLVHEHIGEALDLLGRADEAIAVYEGVVRDTGLPEFMDALSGLLEHREPARSAQLYAEAESLYADRLERFPEAATGHALDHFLGEPAHAQTSIELAENGFAVRRGVPSRIALAQAYLLADRADDARSVLWPALSTPWRSAELFATAARVAEATGAAEAADLAARAIAIRSDVFAHLPGTLADE